MGSGYKSLVVAAALLSCTLAIAGAKDPRWDKVREATRRGLPRSAIRELDGIARSALRSRAYPEATRALLQRIALEGAVQGNEPEEKIARLGVEIGKAPPAIRPLLESMLAQWYWQYFRENRWRFLQRSPTAARPGEDFKTWDLPRLYAEIDLHFRRALAGDELLKRTPIAAWDALIERGTAPDAYRPTLYDFIAWQALDFYTSGEQAGARPEDAFEFRADGPVFGDEAEFALWRIAAADSTSPLYRALRLYQDLERFHAADREASARIDAELARLRFARNHATGGNRDERYKNALARLVERYARHELSARALADWAQVVHDQGDLVTARSLARRGAEAFPESDGGRRCANLIQRIEAKSLEITTERVWNSPPPLLDVRYRNLDRLHFRIVPFDFDGWIATRRMLPEKPDMGALESLLHREPVLSGAAALPETPDFQVRRESLPTPRGLPPGSYYLIASDDSTFSASGHPVDLAVFWVSDLALILRQQAPGGPEGFVLEAGSGSPVPGALVTAWRADPRRATPDQATTTDSNGRFRLRGSDESYYVLAARGQQRLAARDPVGSTVRAQHIPYDRTLLFTDRALYRPGQTIRYKGLCIHVDQERDRYDVLPRVVVVTVLSDANGREVARVQHLTNDYGSFSGTFTAPAEGLRGRLTMSTVAGPRGMAWVSVEEYKRPSFAVTLEAPKQAARLGETVSLIGRSTAYTGSAIDGAAVRWRVTRQASWAPWWCWRHGWPQAAGAQEIGHGTASTGPDGSFTIAFLARPDSIAGHLEMATFSYAIHADVTDPSGETRSADCTVSAGYTALAVSLSAGEWQTPERPVEITARTSTLDGVPASAACVLAVWRLRQPPRVARGDAAERWYSRLRFRAAGGADAGLDSSGPDPARWPEERSVLRRAVTTDSTGLAKVTVSLPAGAYRARLETHDRFGHPVRAETPLRVLDPSASRCPIRVPDLLATPSWSVEPGGEFVAVWGSGYREARAYVELEHRGRMLQAFWTGAGRTQIAIRQRVTEALRGGFTLRVTMVRENRAYLHEQRVDVPWSNKRLTLRWEHFVSSLEPGKRETWTAVVSGRDATRVTAEMVATLYDASLDDMLPSWWPSGFQDFRTESSWRDSRFENVVQDVGWVAGSWPSAPLPAGITYRSFPARAVWDWAQYGNSLWEISEGGIRVEAEKRIDTPISTSRQGINAGGLRELPVDNLREAVSVKAGIVAQDGELHFRGGRGLEEIVPEMESIEVSPLAADRPPGGAPSPGPDLSRVVARRNLEETAFFYPHLLTDRRGRVRIEFTMPEALTEWRFLGFAHDRSMRAGLLEARAVTSRDLMVHPNPPRFLREGDALEMTVRVTNRTGARQSGGVKLTLADAVSGTSADRALGNLAPERSFDLPARASRTVAWRLSVPDGVGPLVFKAVAATDRQSDGEEGVLPVLSRRVLVTESLPLPIRGPGTRAFDFERLRLSGRSGTLRHQSLTVQMVSHPAWYAVMALPYLMEFPHECTEQSFNRPYANALARHIAESDPKIRRVFDQWKGKAALDSPLEQNQALKAVTIEETPWLRQAETESRARRNVGLLFDASRLDDETARLLARLAELQLPDRAWPCFPGGRADDYITLYITTGFGRLRHLGVSLDMKAAQRSLGRLDGWADGLYRDILARGSKDANHLSPTIALYLYGRSFYLGDCAFSPRAKEAVEYWLAQARRYWLQLPHRQSEGQLALALFRFGDTLTARAIVRSLKERAVRSEELGMFWRDEERSWWWYRAPIETQAMMIEAFAEVAGDAAAVEECRVWLLKQKQTQDWKTTKATADAVYALLLRGASLLTSDARVEVSLGGTVVGPDSVEAGTGFCEKRFAGAEITPALGRIAVKKSDSGVAWGSVHWQYLEDMARITSYAGTPLTLGKSLFVRRNGPRGPVIAPLRGPVGVGDELVVRIVLRVDRDMEYVHLKDYRGSGVEPEHVLSGYRYQDGLAYYEETRDAASHFFIDYLPKGTYVFEYPARVQLRGRYQSGTAQIQCMYAPEFNRHSESVELEVR